MLGVFDMGSTSILTLSMAAATAYVCYEFPHFAINSPQIDKDCYAYIDNESNISKEDRINRCDAQKKERDVVSRKQSAMRLIIASAIVLASYMVRINDNINTALTWGSGFTIFYSIIGYIITMRWSERNEGDKVFLLAVIVTMVVLGLIITKGVNHDLRVISLS